MADIGQCEQIVSNVLSTEKHSIYKTVNLNLDSSSYWCISLPRATQASLNFSYMSFERLCYSEKEGQGLAVLSHKSKSLP